MAQGGHSSGMVEEDGEETEDFVPLPFMDPFVLRLKKEGDEKFQAQLYQEAAAIYTFAMNCPALPQLMDTFVIAEKLFRKRAVCFYKMGKYFEAIQDCEGAIEHADCINNKNLRAKSVFIKMKAMVCLGDFVTAFRVALRCKHLRPNCEKTKECLSDIKEKLREAFKKDRSLVHEVLGTMIDFAEMFTMDDNTRVLALEIYTELLDLLDFMLLPGVLRRQAEILVKLGRYEEAKDICAQVLWLRNDDLEALEIMNEIMQRLRERELKQAKETKKTSAVKREPSEMEMIGAAASSKDCQPLLPKVESRASFSREEQAEIKADDEAMITVSEENVGEHERQNASHLRPVNVPILFLQLF